MKIPTNSDRSAQHEFRSSIRRGTGRAHLMLLQNDQRDFSREIIAACIRNYAYDGQSECRRDSYLYGIIESYGKHQEKIKHAVLRVIASETRDIWTLTQLFALSLRFAVAGDGRFREAMYQRFHTKFTHGSAWVGAEEIMVLDGFAGLQHVATVIGQAMMNDPEYWQDEGILDQFNELHPGMDARAELERSALNNKKIAKFLSGIGENNALCERNRQDPETCTDLVKEIRSGRSIGLIRKRSFEPAELIRAAEALTQERDPKQLVRFLWFFNYVQFPLEISPLLLHARRSGKSRERITHRALGALELFSLDRVRDFALARMRTSRSPEDYACLLINNYRPGDASLLLDLAQKAKSKEAVERLAHSVIKIYIKNNDQESVGPLSILYDKLTCSVCRHRVVEAMLKNGVLPPAIREELQYDCNEDIRALAAD